MRIEGVCLERWHQPHLSGVLLLSEGKRKRMIAVAWTAKGPSRRFALKLFLQSAPPEAIQAIQEALPQTTRQIRDCWIHHFHVRPDELSPERGP